MKNGSNMNMNLMNAENSNFDPSQIQNGEGEQGKSN